MSSQIVQCGHCSRDTAGNHAPGCPFYVQQWRENNRWGPVLPTSWKWKISTNAPLCPDLLRLADLGEADNWRGKVVRAFFRLLKWVTGL